MKPFDDYAKHYLAYLNNGGGASDTYTPEDDDAPHSSQLARYLAGLGLISLHENCDDALALHQKLPMLKLPEISFLAMAQKLNILRDALVPVAIMSVGGIAYLDRRAHGFSDMSDLFDATLAYTYIAGIRRDGPIDRRAEVNKRNIHFNRFAEAGRLVKVMADILGVKPRLYNYFQYMEPTDESFERRTFEQGFRLCQLAANVHNVRGEIEIYTPRNAMGYLSEGQISSESLNIARASALYQSYHMRDLTDKFIAVWPEKWFILSGTNLKITPRHDPQGSFIVITDVCRYTEQDLDLFDTFRPGLLLKDNKGYRTAVKLNGKGIGSIVAGKDSGPSNTVMADALKTAMANHA